jgi:riboflavin kinase/FMN adenylyltransferase
MKIVRGIDSIREIYRGKLFLALGNFDGVHLGHREIIRNTVQTANDHGGKSAVLIFSPHPLAVLYPDKSPCLLLNMDDRIRLLGQAGIDFVIVHPFTREFAKIDPEGFAGQILRDKLGVSGIVVGFDYSFGRAGSGSPGDMCLYGKNFGFSVQVVEPVKIEGEPVGSTRIRALLAAGRVDEAGKLLGYPFFIRGVVVHGDGRGRRLGYPTANVSTSADVIHPGHGVYLCLVQLENKEEKLWGLTNVGHRPTFAKADTSTEVFVLDFQKNLYGQELTLYFLQRIRVEKVFTGPGELIAQIEKDIRFARTLIDGWPPEKGM